MKKQAGPLGEIVVLLLSILIGCGMIYGSLFRPEVGEQALEILRIPLVSAGVGGLLVLLVLLRLLFWGWKSKELFVDYQADGGSVGISTRAIQEFVERVGLEFAAVNDIKVRLCKRRGTLDMLVEIFIQGGSKVPELSQVLQQRIRESVSESLGLEELGSIVVHVKKIDPAKAEAVASEA